MTAPLDLGRLRALLEKATPGPWRAVEAETAFRIQRASDPWNYITTATYSPLGGIPKWEGMQANAALIVAAVNALPALLSRVEELEATVAQWKEGVESANRLTQRFAAERDEARARAAALEAGLRRYGGHRGCRAGLPSLETPGKICECKCGWDELARALLAPEGGK